VDVHKSLHDFSILRWGCLGWTGLGWKLPDWLTGGSPPYTCGGDKGRGEGLQGGFETFEYICGWADTVSFKTSSVL